jgi:hypothetical protein
MLILICISMLSLSLFQRAYTSLLAAFSWQNPVGPHLWHNSSSFELANICQYTELYDFQENGPDYTDNV